MQPILRTLSYGFVQPTLRLPSFHHFPFHDSIFKYLEASDIHTPTYIQYAFFSALAKEKNKVYHLTAPTGSGKTLTYLLPIISQLKQEEEGVGPLTASQRPRAIVLTATKELVVQGRQVGKQISHHSKLKVEGLGIGRTLKEEKQTIMNGVDLLMSTYSRLSMQLRQNNLYTSHLKWIVID
jgi:ATP-dependent RNA helicase RhlE